jgi:hypothetical protein
MLNFFDRVGVGIERSDRKPVLVLKTTQDKTFEKQPGCKKAEKNIENKRVQLLTIVPVTNFIF